MTAPTFELDPGDEQHGALIIPWRGLRPGQTVTVEHRGRLRRARIMLAGTRAAIGHDDGPAAA